MLTTYLRTAYRSIIKRKLYSSINILGLAVGLAAFLLIAIYVRHELSYDRYYRDYENIYRVVRDEYTCSPPAMAQYLKDNIAQVESSSHIIRRYNLLLSCGDNYYTEDEYFYADNEFINMFEFELIQGDRSSVLKSMDDVLISSTLANKYFGRDDPLGKLLTVSRQYNYRVAGVFKDIPGNTHFKTDIIFPVAGYFRLTGDRVDSWSSNYTYTYLKVASGTETATLDKRMVEIEKELTGWTPESGEPYEQYFKFQPVSEIHLHSHRQQELMVNGNIRNVYIFSTIAFLILLIACINYVNITTAIASDRTREIGIRKVMGIKRLQLVKQFLTESFIIAFLSIIIAIALASVCLSFFGSLMDRDLALHSTDIPLAILFSAILLVITGLGTGLIPSRSLSGLSALSVMKSASFKGKNNPGTRDILVLAQFVVAIVLIILTLNVKRQLNYISDIDPGYKKEQIIVLSVFDRSLSSNMQVVKDELRKIGNVSNVSTSFNLPNNISNFTRPDWFCDDVRDCTPISYNPVDYDFVELYDIEISSGRNFSRDYPADAEGAFLLNQKAVDLAGWDSPIGMELTHWNGQKGTVVGVFRDFNFRSLHSEIAPLYLFLDETVSSFISISLKGDNMQETLKSIEAVLQQYSPGAPFQYSFFDEEFNRAYETEQRLGSLFAFFAVLAVLLGCLGLFGMTSFSLAKRTKEIGVRKVFGANAGQALSLLSLSFVRPVLLANIIAWPIAYYAVNRWLQTFAYRAPISVWIFLASAMIVTLITLITVTAKSLDISRNQPADSLRYE